MPPKPKSKPKPKPTKPNHPDKFKIDVEDNLTTREFIAEIARAGRFISWSPRHVNQRNRFHVTSLKTPTRNNSLALEYNLVYAEEPSLIEDCRTTARSHCRAIMTARPFLLNQHTHTPHVNYTTTSLIGAQVLCRLPTVGRKSC